MLITTKGRFAVAAMADLTLCGGNAPVKMSAISDRLKISINYLDQLFGKLRRSLLVESVRGPGGGYYLARPANKITIADIIVAVDEQLDATSCGGQGNCHDDHPCITHKLWTGLNDNIYSYLTSITLQQLVDSQATSGRIEAPIAKIKVQPMSISI